MAKYLVGGFVYEGSGNTKKLQGVTISSITPKEYKTVLSNADGYFEIELDTTYDTDLTAEKNGYFGVTKRVKKEKGDITLVTFNLQKELQLTDKPDKPEVKDTPKEKTLTKEQQFEISQKEAKQEARKEKRAETPKSSYVIGGLSGLALGTTAYILSNKVVKSKWGQLGMATASAVIFYFIGFNISNFVQNKKEIKNEI
jgi:hypothetical protein